MLYASVTDVLAPHLSQVYSPLTSSSGIRSTLRSLHHYSLFPPSLFPTLLSHFPPEQSVGISSPPAHPCVYASAKLLQEVHKLAKHAVSHTMVGWTTTTADKSRMDRGNVAVSWPQLSYWINGSVSNTRSAHKLLLKPFFVKITIRCCWFRPELHGLAMTLLNFLRFARRILSSKSSWFKPKIGHF